MRALDADGILGFWQRQTGRLDMYYRDKRLIEGWLRDGYTSTQVLMALVDYLDNEPAPSFRFFADRFEETVDDEVMMAEARLVPALMRLRLLPQDDLPACYWTVLDHYAGSGVPSALIQRGYATAQQEMGRWLDDKLGSATVGSGAISSPSRPGKPKRPPVHRPERLDR